MGEPSKPAPAARHSKRPERPFQKFRRSLVAGAARCLIVVLSRLPFGLAGWIGARLGGLLYLLARREARRAVEHLALAFPEQPARWHRRTARRVFRHFGRIVGEFLAVLRWSPERRMGLIVNRDEFAANLQHDAREAGRGVVCLTAHIGNWELMGSAGQSAVPLTVVARRPNDPRLAKLADELRARAGYAVIFQDDSPRSMFRVLRNRELLGMLADQDLRRLPGIFVPFFGRDAYTVTSPVEIAQAAGATLRCYFPVRVRGGYRIVMSEPIDVGTKGDGPEVLRRATLEWTRFLEQTIRQHPEQWVWMHRRWRTRPEDVAARRAAESAAPA